MLRFSGVKEEWPHHIDQNDDDVVGDLIITWQRHSLVTSLPSLPSQVFMVASKALIFRKPVGWLICKTVWWNNERGIDIGNILGIHIKMYLTSKYYLYLKRNRTSFGISKKKKKRARKSHFDCGESFTLGGVLKKKQGQTAVTVIGAFDTV